jgi:catabolite regulation protein CreA
MRSADSKRSPLSISSEDRQTKVFKDRQTIIFKDRQTIIFKDRQLYMAGGES